MAEATDRPQDAGRRHRRKGAPSTETRALLDRYQAAMRTELESLLESLVGQPGLAGTSVRPSLADRSRTWDLAVKLARELGAAVDPPDPETDDAGDDVGPVKRRGRIDYGGA